MDARPFNTLTEISPWSWIWGMSLLKSSGEIIIGSIRGEYAIGNWRTRTTTLSVYLFIVNLRWRHSPPGMIRERVTQPTHPTFATSHWFVLLPNWFSAETGRDPEIALLAGHCRKRRSLIEPEPSKQDSPAFKVSQHTPSRAGVIVMAR